MTPKHWSPGGPIPYNLFLSHHKKRDVTSVFNLSPEVPLTQGLESLADFYREQARPSTIRDILYFLFKHEVVGFNDGTFAVLPLTYASMYTVAYFHNRDLFYEKRPGVLKWGDTQLTEGCAIAQDLNDDVEEFLDSLRRHTLEKHALIWEDVRRAATGLTTYQPIQRLLLEFEEIWHDHLVTSLNKVRIEDGALYHPACIASIKSRFAAWRNGKLRKARALPSGELEHIRSLVGDVQNDLEGFDLSLAVASICEWQPAKSPVSHWTFHSKNGWTRLSPPINEAQRLWDSLFSSTLKWPELEIAWKKGCEEKLSEGTGQPPFKYQLKNLQRLINYKPKHEMTKEYLDGILTPILP